MFLGLVKHGMRGFRLLDCRRWRSCRTGCSRFPSPIAMQLIEEELGQPINAIYSELSPEARRGGQPRPGEVCMHPYLMSGQVNIESSACL